MLFVLCNMAAGAVEESWAGEAGVLSHNRGPGPAQEEAN